VNTPTDLQFFTSFKAFITSRFTILAPEFNLNCRNVESANKNFTYLETKVEFAEVLKPFLLYGCSDWKTYSDIGDIIQRKNQALCTMKYICDHVTSYDPWAVDFCKAILKLLKPGTMPVVPLNSHDEVIESFIIGFIDALRNSIGLGKVGGQVYADR